MSAETISGDPCRCNGEGVDDEGRLCDCEAGEAYFRREHDRHAWMASYARQANAYAREGDHESAEQIRKMVCS